MNIRFDIDFKVNRVVKYFVLTDLTLLGAWGLISPIFAVFVVQEIPGGNLATVGITAALYWLIKSLVQLPIANFLDKTDGEKDDFYALLASLTLAGISAFAFLGVKEVWQLYLVQSLQGLSFGIYVPAWSGIFSRHVDRNRHSFDWSLASTAVGIAAGVGGFLGGFLANWFGFNIIFMTVGIISLASIFLVLSVPEIVTPRRTTKEPLIRDHKPPMISH